MKLVFPIALVSLLLFSCVASREKKSARYYVENEKEIQDMLVLYRSLYKHQPFNIGFSDRSFKYVGMDIMTDTVRYAINNNLSQDHFLEAVEVFRFDREALRRLYEQMYRIRSIWLGTDEMYFKGEIQKMVYLSFRSASSGNPYHDRKYYNLIFFDPSFITAEAEKIILEAGFTKIKKDVYFKIMGRFR